MHADKTCFCRLGHILFNTKKAEYPKPVVAIERDVIGDSSLHILLSQY